jgi:hypothetical protein
MVSSPDSVHAARSARLVTLFPLASVFRGGREMRDA